MKKREFVLLRMLFDMDLYNAIQKLDEIEVENIFQRKYKDEINENMVDSLPIFSKAEIESIKLKQKEEAKHDDYSWAL